MSWKDTIENMTNNSEAAEITRGDLPIGYVIRKEPKTNRRSFALQQSILNALQDIATEKGSNVNAIVNDVLLKYVNDYYGKRG